MGTLIVETGAKIVSDSAQAKLMEDNSAVMRNIADATEVLNLNLAQVIELNRLTQKIEPLGLLDL